MLIGRQTERIRDSMSERNNNIEETGSFETTVLK